MADMIDHRALRRQILATEHLEPFRVTSDGYLTGGPDGDERLILRVVLNSEAARPQCSRHHTARGPGPGRACLPDAGH